jgi:polyisoprenoid-binding protein YceI
MVKLFQIFFTVLLFLSISIASDFKLDKAHSNIGFNVTHMVVATVSGKFTDYNVDLKFDENDLPNSKVFAKIKVSSIDTENERRDKHLRSNDFFNSEKYPEITFESSKIQKTENGFLAYGSLTIRNVTKEIALPFIVKGPVNDKWGNIRIGVSATLSINRQDYDVKWNDTLDSGGLVVSDDVEIKIDAEFIRQAESI